MARFGAFYFSTVKLFQGKTKTKIPPSEYILVSDNESIREKLENKFQKNIERANLENGKIVFSQSFSEKKNTEVILDTNFLGFAAAISFLETSKNKSLKNWKTLNTNSKA